MNWREINLNTEEGEKQFNRFIGEQLGFYVYHYDKDVEPNCYYMLWTPDSANWVGHDGRYAHEHLREPLGWHVGERKTEAEAWDDMPNWTGNDRTALTLSDEPDFILGRSVHGWFASFFGAHILVAEHVDYFSEISHAIVRAWAEKWEKQRASEG